MGTPARLAKHDAARCQIPNPVLVIPVSNHQVLAVRTEWAHPLHRTRSRAELHFDRPLRERENADGIGGTLDRQSLQLGVRGYTPLPIEGGWRACNFTQVHPNQRVDTASVRAVALSAACVSGESWADGSPASLLRRAMDSAMLARLLKRCPVRPV